jgi:ribokinase
VAGPPSVAVVGSINLDLVARCERLPRPGETLTDATFERVPGGKGANQALAAARLGAAVRMVGAVGEDAFADEALTLLREGGVDLGSVRRVAAPTGVALVLVGGDGETQIVVAPGANRLVEPDGVGDADALLCQLEVPVEAVAAAAREARFLCLNAAPARRLPAELLARVDLLVVNRYELEAVGTFPGLAALTLGGEGAILLEAGEEVARAAPPPVQAVDGTAAGDAFTACLLVSLLEGRDREEALRRACAAGALAASRPGAQPSLPTAAEVDEILRSA